MTIARALRLFIIATALVLCGLSVWACQQAPTAPAASEPFDLVVLGGKVMDPESGLEAVRNIGIRDGRIAAISEQRLVGRIQLDAAGQVVAPGFIDLHSHGMVVPSMWMQAFDGVTTALDLEGGNLPIPEAYAIAQAEGRPLNYGYSANWAAARSAVLAGTKLDGHFLTMLAAFAKPNWQQLATQAQSTEILRLVEQGVTVAFFGVDGTRADPGYFETVYKTAIEAGAQEAVVVDTIGIGSPEAVADLVGRTKEWLGKEVPVHFHGHNDFGLATAAALAAVRAGASWIQGTVNGMGERAGNANLPEIALALRGLYGVDTNLRLDKARAFSERLRELSGYELEPFKPLVGDNLFRRESGAVASQFHDPPAIEPYSSDLVAAERSIVLGKKSGIDSVRIKAEELGLDLSDDAQRELLARVKELGTSKRGLVTDDEFRELARG